MNINESTQNYIREQIPTMAKNIHEGAWSSFKQGLGAIGRRVRDVASNEYKRLVTKETQSALNRARDIDQQVYVPRLGDQIRMSPEQILKLRDKNIVHPGTPPPPNAPNYAQLAAEYQSKLKQYQAKVRMQRAEAGVARVNLGLGLLKRSLQGNYQPGYTPPPGTPGSPPPIPSKGVKGRLAFLKGRLP